MHWRCSTALAWIWQASALATGSQSVHLWWTFQEFCQQRDQLALTAGPAARERCGDLLSYQPGPLLSAAAMLIIDVHPAETAEDPDLPEAALLLAGEGLRPWMSLNARP